MTQAVFSLLLLFQSSPDGGTGIGCSVVPIVLLGLVAYFIWQGQQRKIKAAREAYAAYQEALARLKQQPSNPELKQYALQLGRDYSELSRGLKGKGGVMVYDEVALMNDINAVCAGATANSYQQSPQPSTQSQASVEQRLAYLDDLGAGGLIAEDEYIQQRRKVLGEI